jgi:hypothetical protein
VTDGLKGNRSRVEVALPDLSVAGFDPARWSVESMTSRMVSWCLPR